VSDGHLSLQRATADIARIPPARAYRRLSDAFLIAVAAGEIGAATRLVRCMYERGLPLPAGPVTAFSTGAIDGFCAVAGLGDVTRGRPAAAETTGDLPARVVAAERAVRHRLVLDAYPTSAPVDASWSALPSPQRNIPRWRWIQQLARPIDGAPASTEVAALDALVSYLDDWDPASRGVGHGAELVLALDLALRHGRPELVPGWLARHGHRLGREPFLLEECLCLPAVATAIAGGALASLVDLPPGATSFAVAAIEAAVTAMSGPDDESAPWRMTLVAPDEGALLIRTNFAHPTEWRALRARIETPSPDGFLATLEIVDDRRYDGLDVARLRELLLGDTAVAFLVDRDTLTHRDRPLLAVNLAEPGGDTLRVVPSALWSVENNLTLANMDWDELAAAVDDDGVFRGIDE
jgi:hypothetical protein